MDDASHPLMGKRPFFRRDPITTILLLVAVFLLSQIAAALLIGLYPGLRNWTGDQASAWLDTVPAQFAYVLLAEAFSVAAVLQLLKRAGVKLKRIGLVTPKAMDIIYALAAYAGYFVTYMIIIVAAGVLVKGLDFEQKQELGFDAPTGRPELMMAFISLVVLPPIAEEIMFRGLLFSSFRQKFRLRYAVLATSLLFGVAHLQFGNGAPLLWVAAMDTFTLSCFLCVLREKTGSVWPGVFLHAIKNSVAFVVLYHTRF